VELGFGLVTCQRYPGDPRGAADLYREALEYARACEAAGLDSIWTSEHHYWDDDYMPSLLVTSAALAAVTERITIGTGVLLAPLYDPLRLAEDAATVELISGGRFILGLGIGWRREEFDRLGVPMERLGRRMRETVEILRAAWSDRLVEHQGQIFQIEPTNVTPKPSAPIPIWLGAFADPAIRRAGRIADGYLGSSSRRELAPLDEVKRRKAIAEEGLKKSGRDRSGFRLAFHEQTWVTEDPDEIDEVLPHIHYSRWKYADMGPEFSRGPGELPEPPPLDDGTRQAILDGLIYGTPDEVAKRVGEFRDVVGDDLHLIARSYFPGVPREKTLRQIELLGEVKKRL
jgi:probable F420-dependent oxidoreductase